jgi:hypothetical protein
MRPADFVRHVRDACHQVPTRGRFGDHKVFIASAWAWLRCNRRAAGFDDVTLDAFKARLVVANHNGDLVLARADLVAAMDPDLLRKSETQHLSSRWHFIRSDGFAVDRWVVLLHEPSRPPREYSYGLEESVRRSWDHVTVHEGWAELRNPAGELAARKEATAWAVIRHGGRATDNARVFFTGPEANARRCWARLDVRQGWAELRKPGGAVVERQSGPTLRTRW